MLSLYSKMALDQILRGAQLVILSANWLNQIFFNRKLPLQNDGT